MQGRDGDLQPNDVPDDAQVVARVLGGDSQQFALLIAKYQRAMYRYAVSMVLDHDVGADMVQDAFVRAYTHLGTCRDHGRFRAWLFQTLRHRCLDHLKEARRRNVPLERAGTVADRQEDPADRVQRARLGEDIARALQALPHLQREAFVMHYVEELPYDTMAELLGASVSALKMRVLRAREALAQALASGGHDVTGTVSIRLSTGGG